jgi:hypothetical protein
VPHEIPSQKRVKAYFKNQPNENKIKKMKENKYKKNI